MTTLHRVQRSRTLGSLDRLITVDANRGEIRWDVLVSQSPTNGVGSPKHSPPLVTAGRIAFRVACGAQHARRTMHTTARCSPPSLPPGHARVHSHTSSPQTKSITARSPLVGIPRPPARASGTTLPQRGREFSHRRHSRLNISYFWSECGQGSWRKFDGPRSFRESSRQSDCVVDLRDDVTEMQRVQGQKL